MAPSVHSLWGASGSKRLMACPGSFRLSSALSGGVRRSSIYAAEGTYAHEINERCLDEGYDAKEFLHNENTVDGHRVKVDHEMVEACQTYVDFVRDLKARGYTVHIEVRVSLDSLFGSTALTPVSLFGTADCVAWNPTTRHLVMVDFKYGRGIAVEVEDNSQFLYYALGCILDLGLTPRTVELVVVQPRAPHKDGPIRRAEYDALDVLQWGHDVLKPAIEASMSDGSDDLNPGEHCRFCPALSTCPAIFAQAQEAARTAFGPVNIPAPAPRQPGVPPEPHELTDAEMGEMLEKASLFEAWVKSLREEAFARLSDGRPVPGFKLVKKKGVRRWEDEDAVVKTMFKSGVPSEEWSEMKVRTPAQLEKVLGKGKFKELLIDHVTVPDTGVTMVADGDPRPAVVGKLQPTDVFNAVSSLMDND